MYGSQILRYLKLSRQGPQLNFSLHINDQYVQWNIIMIWSLLVEGMKRKNVSPHCNCFSNHFQIVGLLALMLMSWLVASLVLMLVPVWLGRQTFSLWLSDTPRIYELYTAALGLYTW